MSPGTFLTATGKLVCVLKPTPDVVDIADIALSLAKQCRFAGHLRADVWHYSVAQHSVLVSYECMLEHALIGLLHDASEAYMQDIISPIKHTLGTDYRRIERDWAFAIGERFGLAEKLAYLPADVKRADQLMLAAELRDLCHPNRALEVDGASIADVPRIERISASHSHSLFMKRFHELQSLDARSYVP